MSYRQKNCLFCGTSHKKRGPYCGKVCSNKHRKHSDETKAKMSASQQISSRVPETLEKTWLARTKGQLTGAAIKRKETLSEVELNPENLYLPPMKPALPDGVSRADGDLWYDAE